MAIMQSLCSYCAGVIIHQSLRRRSVGARKAVGDLGGSLAVLESELERALGVRV